MLPAASRRYSRFLETVFGGLAEMPRRTWDKSLSELELQSLWFAGEFGHEFTTTEGKPVSIRDFGVWNHSSGPDFTGCAVQCDGQILRGEIELDPDARDWERHGHGANPAYEQVVLHLFTAAPEARVFTRTAQHREVPQVLLTPAMLRNNARPYRIAEARLGRCSMPLREMKESGVSALLEAAAQYRLQRKGEKLHALVRIHGREQAIYQSLANALGYRHNQRAFTILAQRLPLRMMLKQEAGQREALLFGVSGFLEAVRYEDTEPETRLYLRTIWSQWWKQRAAYAEWLLPPNQPVWQIAGARPGNHPQRRIGALSAMLQQWKRVFAPLRDVRSWSRKDFTKTLLSLEHDYWNQHYTLLAPPGKAPVALIGKSRVQEMLANVAYPLLVPEDEKLWEDYKELPAVLDNQKVRRAALRLFGEHPEAARFQKRLFHQQGLLQIYEDYCLEDDSSCAECPFPERLKEWS
ncbi:MAG: hypothetical protein RL693_1659 [Verrucomicrobiota bacterium]|jgi:hypothetical protein